MLVCVCVCVYTIINRAIFAGDAVVGRGSSTGKRCTVDFTYQTPVIRLSENGLAVHPYKKIDNCQNSYHNELLFCRSVN